MIRILPDLDDDLLLRLFHKSARHVWTSADVDWQAPVMLDDRETRALGRLLAPIYLGEQSAMIGASAIMPQLMAVGETSAQVYLASFIYDEARHFEVLTQLYHRLEVQPVGLREVPEMLRYHHRLRQGDRVDWVWGILISDLFAKNFYGIFSRAQPDALFGRMSRDILRDESRHQAFADEYLTRALRAMTPERKTKLVAMRDDLMQIMSAIYARLVDDCAVLGIDGDAFLGRLLADIERHAHRVGLIDGPDGGPPAGPVGRDRAVATLPKAEQAGAAGVRSGAQARAALAAAGPGSDETEADCGDACDTCFVAALCQSRLVRRAAAGRGGRRLSA